MCFLLYLEALGKALLAPTLPTEISDRCSAYSESRFLIWRTTAPLSVRLSSYYATRYLGTRPKRTALGPPCLRLARGMRHLVPERTDHNYKIYLPLMAFN